jgi:radical SAM superfamily enzyme YgiQ (UPF0313 family)
MLTPLSVAAAAPRDVEVSVVDESVEPVDLDADVDLVGISFMTFNAPRAYELARRFRERGRTVVFGGYHPTLQPEEAAEHCDSVCVGAAEPSVPRMIEDWRSGRLQRFYRHAQREFRSAPVDPGLLRGRQYMAATLIQATRGCRNRCEFCSVSAFSSWSLLQKPVDEVVEEIRRGGRRRVLFIDDSLSADPAYLRALLEAIVPLRVRWYSQMGFDVTRDEALLDLMHRSGCRGLFIGLESLSQASLEETRKGFNRAADYGEGIRRLHERGIAVVGAFVLGYDHDGPDVFDRTLGFLEEAEVDALQLTVLTPFPGTPLYRRLEREGRLLDRNWEHYDLGHVVFEPRAVGAAELRAGHDRILARFYSWPSILRRLGRGLRHLRPSELGLLGLVNLGYRLKTRRDGYVR